MSELLVKPCETREHIVFKETIHPAPFQCNVQINPKQTSKEVDHVNNIEYLRWIDKGSQLHCDACGWDRQKLLNSGVMWFVARHEIDYLSEARTSDCLRLTTWVEDIRRVKSWRTTYIHAIENKERVVCRCKTLWVLVDLETRKPTTIPNQMAESLHPLHPPKGIPEGSGFLGVSS
ncbi:MAG: acyl-CoA thioesterase [Phycisphaerales bacterium]|nr:acyl-CoA thioesterase [Planctomycetota bacterium]MBL6997573.1 acyl-CoA thioesterase [Phycisphaerales bacterium]